MDEEIWWVVAGLEEAGIMRSDPATYDLRVETAYSTATITLDRKHLKDLFNALGTELNAWVD